MSLLREGKKMKRRVSALLVAVSVPFLVFFAQTPELSKTVRQFVKVGTPKIVLTHVRVIDGTGVAAVEDQNVVIEGGKISAIEKGADVTASVGVTVLDLRGYSVMPGIVGMHNHLFYVAQPNLRSDWSFEDPFLVPQMTFFGAAIVSGWRGHHDKDDRQRGALYRPKPET
jgi:hypothetical protein